MRKINHIVVHCSATNPDAKISTLQRYWKDVKGWNTVGYHYIIEDNGILVTLLPDEQVSNGVYGHNSDSINVCYIGGIKDGHACDTRTEKQKATLIALLKMLKELYPDAEILGHRDLSEDLNGNGIIEQCEWMKECPSFNAMDEYQYL